MRHEREGMAYGCVLIGALAIVMLADARETMVSHGPNAARWNCMSKSTSSTPRNPAPEARDAALEGNAADGHRPGKIEVSSRAIATVAGRAVAQSYGVVGIAARHPRFGTVEILTPEHYARGVDVRFVDDRVAIDLYVVLEYGLRVTEIAHNIMQNVKFAVEHALDMRVDRINVNVQALRVDEKQ